MDYMNIAFPRRYSFIVLSSHATGHNALWVFLQRCGVRLVRAFVLRDGYIYVCFQILMNLLKCRKQQPMALCFSEINYPNESLIYKKITKKVPAVMLVRDPISVLRSHINLYRFWNHRAVVDGDGISFPAKPFCIGYDIHSCSMTVSETPDIRAIHLWIATIDGNYSDIKHFAYIDDEHQKQHYAYSCIYRSSYENIKDKITSINYLDMDCLSLSRAFATMENLAERFGFMPPREDDRMFYEQKLYSSNAILYPFVLDISNMINTEHNSDKTHTTTSQFVHNAKAGAGIELYYSNSQRLEYFFGGVDMIPICDIIDCVVDDKEAQWFCNKDYINYLHHLSEDHKHKLSSYFLQAQSWIKEQQENMENNKLHERDVLEYLKNNHALYHRLKLALEYETSLIKEQARDIFESWNFYHEFLGLEQKDELC